MPEYIEIANRRLGPAYSPYLIAEMSGNHNGDIGRAFALMEAAYDAGADAVKLQTYSADTITLDHDGPGFTINGGLWDGSRLYDLYKTAQTPWKWHEKLFEKARDIGITVFSSPFDASAVDLLVGLGSPAYKIASFELIDLPLIEKVAATGKPIILSTGLANLGEIQQAVATVRTAGVKDIVLLHCISSYPAPAEDSHLLTMPHMGSAFGTLFGLSDHTAGTAVSVAAVALGASVIEKHLTLKRTDGGPDAAFSLEPDEFKRLVEDCRTAWSALGRINYEIKNPEAASLIFRRSLYAVKDISAGETLTVENIRSIRPGYGLEPKFFPKIIGSKARVAIKRGTPINWNLLQL